ncbi:uncharacterized protein LOC118749055 [Rhagoletis pomonella]|uniref:uncharacterized protein LOC118749055 n=1 Tax=Rhagoletis pomonella TaxID=28610 RepID=UPI0017839F47|nr:uncharacterized protein LOC118749055 [Rhagoletis pomonella]
MHNGCPLTLTPSSSSSAAPTSIDAVDDAANATATAGAAASVYSVMPALSLAAADKQCPTDSSTRFSTECSLIAAVGVGANTTLSAPTSSSFNSYASMLNSEQESESAAAKNLSSQINNSQINKATTPVNRRATRRNIVGTNANTELKVAARMRWLHLSSFESSVIANSIVEYVSKHANINKGQLLCYKLVKNDADLKSITRVNFKLGTPDSFYSNLLSSDLWPVGVNVRPFLFCYKRC